jgi:hypothetical protein
MADQVAAVAVVRVLRQEGWALAAKVIMVELVLIAELIAQALAAAVLMALVVMLQANLAAMVGRANHHLLREAL